MNKPKTFQQMLSDYFLKYIPERTGYSDNTIKSYRDTFILMFRYHKSGHREPLAKLTFDRLDADYISSFLAWLGKDKGYSVSSINQRLAAIHAFYKYVQMYAPEYSEFCNPVLEIKSRKVASMPMNYLTPDAVRSLLRQTETDIAEGIRDLSLLTLLYDSGARVQEIADLTFGDVRFKKPATIKVTGKGNKSRIIPIMPQTLDILNVYCRNCQKSGMEIRLSDPLFFNKGNNKLTRAGITYILQKYTDKARSKNPELFPTKVSPHTLRHSKAMHLLEGGVNLIYIRDFLGHASILTTEVYAKANPEIKRKVLEAAGKEVLPEEHYSSVEKQDMLDWLKKII